MQIKTGKSYLCRTGNHMVEIRESTTYNCKPCFYGTIWFLTPGQTFATEERALYTSRRFWPSGEAIDGYFDAVQEVRIIPRLCDANTGEPMGQERLEVVDDGDASPSTKQDQGGHLP